jgi:hypothetical protein
MIQVGAELGRDDTCDEAYVTGEGRGLPASGVVMKAEAVLVAGEWLEPDDGFLIDIDVEEAPLGPDGDVVMAAIGTDGRAQKVCVVREPGTAPDPTFGGRHGRLLRAAGERLLRLERIARETPAEGVRSLVPRGDEAEERGAQLGHGMEVAVSQALPVHDAEE